MQNWTGIGDANLVLMQVLLCFGGEGEQRVIEYFHMLLLHVELFSYWWYCIYCYGKVETKEDGKGSHWWHGWFRVPCWLCMLSSY